MLNTYTESQMLDAAAVLFREAHLAGSEEAEDAVLKAVGAVELIALLTGGSLESIDDEVWRRAASMSS